MRVVLDTNIVLSASVFRRGKLAWLRPAWESGLFVPLVNRETSKELLRVLTYPKFKLSATEIEYLFSCYLRYAEVITMQETLPTLPECRDTDDQVFLRLAIAAQADVLVTGDNDLLDLAGQTPFTIETVSQFQLRFDSLSK